MRLAATDRSTSERRLRRALWKRFTVLFGWGWGVVLLLSGCSRCRGNDTPADPASRAQAVVPRPPPTPEEAVSLGLVHDSSGFTLFQPSADTVKIHVSQSAGSDANDGRTPEQAVQSIARGVELLRDGSADWLLFKRGDVWATGFDGWGLSGRSAKERLLVGAYGDGERPRFEFEEDNIAVTGAVTDKSYVDNLVFTSLHFVGANHDPARGPPRGPSPACVSWLRGGNDVLFEDVRFEYCAVHITHFDGFPASRFRFFRCLFLDSYSMDESHAQGIFVHGVKDLSIEESVFDRCGWHPDYPEADPTIFNHCIYWQMGGPADGLVRGNLILRGSSHGAQMRSSGRVEGNVFAKNAIGGFIGANFKPAPTGTPGTVIGNLITEGEDITPRPGHPGDLYRGWGWDIVDDPPLYGAVIKDNILTHCRAKTCRPLRQEYPNNTLENNLVWDWKSVADGYMEQSPGPFKDPNRTLASYHASLGREGSFEAFAKEARKRSKTHFLPAYSAERIIRYFREGFSSP